MRERVPIQPQEATFDLLDPRASYAAIAMQLPMQQFNYEGSVIGDAVSRKKGTGYEFAGVREYQLGDDVRHIDWPATARQTDGQLQVREHQKEVSPDLWVVTDMLQHRNSKFPGYHSEQQLALGAMSTLMHVAEAHAIPSGVILANDARISQVQRYAVTGREHIVQTARRAAEMIDETAGAAHEQGQLAKLLKFTGRLATDGVVLVVSDFRDTSTADDPEHGWAKPLKRLAAQGNDIIAVELINKWDFELPKINRNWATRDGATRLSRKELEQAYPAKAAAKQASIDEVLRQVRAHHITLDTNDTRWLTSLRAQLRLGR